MTKYKMLFFLFFGTISSVSGQSISDRQIEIFAFASINGTKFIIEIITQTDSTKIKIKVRDSVSVKLYIDKEYNDERNYLLSITNKKHFNNDTFRIHSNIFKSIEEKYTYYSEDSLKIANSENEGYLNLINEVFKSPSDSLDNTILNKQRIVLDGIAMTFTFIDNGNKRTIYASTPTFKSHRLLYELVTSSSSLYRTTKKNDFLKPRGLFGY